MSLRILRPAIIYFSVSADTTLITGEICYSGHTFRRTLFGVLIEHCLGPAVCTKTVKGFLVHVMKQAVFLRDAINRNEWYHLDDLCQFLLLLRAHKGLTDWDSLDERGNEDHERELAAMFLLIFYICFLGPLIEKSSAPWETHKDSGFLHDLPLAAEAVTDSCVKH